MAELKDSATLFDRLEPLIESGDRLAVVGFFAGVSERERRSLVRPLRAYTKAVVWSGVMPGENWATAQDRWNRRQSPVLIAGCAVISQAPALGKWINARRFLLPWGRWPIRECVEVLRERDPAWLAEVPEAVCAEVAQPDWQTWELVNAFAELAGVRMNASVNYVHGWAQSIDRIRGSIEEVVEAVRAEPRHGEFLPVLFEAEDGDGFFGERARIRHVVGLLAAEPGPVRDSVLDASLRRLLRGGRQGVMRDHTAFWGQAGATDAEVVERIGSCISLLSSSYGFVAKEFLASVKRASDAGMLDVELALEAASVVVARPEKYLVKAGLAWLDGLARRHPERIGELVGTAALAFGNQGPDVQERAVKVVTKYAEKLSADDRARVIGEARLLLAPDIAAAVASALGDGGAAGREKAEYPEIAPFQPRPMPRPISSPAELAEEYARLMTEEPREALDLERVLAAFVEFAASDREGLRVAITPVMERYQDFLHWGGGQQLTPQMTLFRLAEAAAGSETRVGTERATFAELWSAGATDHLYRTQLSPAHLIAMRMAEIAAVLRKGELPPVLLSTPTDVTGMVDPKVLRDRLRTAEADGWQPLTIDFHQALLRLPADCGGVDGSELTSEFGLVFAAWCDGERVVLPDTSRTPFHTESARDRPSTWNTFLAVDPEAPHRPGSLLDLALRAWSRPGLIYDGSEWVACWPALVPSRPDLVVAAMSRLWGRAVDPSVASLLAEADVAQQDGLHFLVGRYFADQSAAVRAGGVDAALLLASRGMLNGGLLGADLADALQDRLLAGGLRKAVPCLRDLANSGAAVPAWEAVAVLLDRALPPAVPKTLTGTGELLALATELADALGVRGPMAAVSALAAKKGSGAVQNGARRLAAVLAGD